MPIVRSYMCSECAHHMTVTLDADQWDAPAPDCPMCAENPMSQQFRPVAIVGAPSARARAIAEDIAANDYHVADMQHEHRPQGTPTVRYKDVSSTSAQGASTWGASQHALELAVAGGRQTRLKYGSGLDILQENIKNGTEPDLIENSKRRAMRVW